MRLWCVWLACAGWVQGAMIRGVVLEHVSGRPLARARVKLEALRGDSVVQVATVSADRTGQYAFFSVPAGVYLLSAERSAFAQANYGQKRRNGPGMPIPLDADASFFAELRLSRLAAITGTVYDENRVGLAGQRAVVYPLPAPPLRIAGQAQTDDRGVYRVSGLQPGRYLVRTAAGTLDDGSGILPTFFGDTLAVEEAKPVAVRLDEEASETNIQPLPGRLFRLSGRIFCSIQPPPGPVTVILSSDTGRRQVGSGCGGVYHFEGLAPSQYELYIEIPGGGGTSVHEEMFLDRDRESNYEVLPPPRVSFRLRDEDGRRLSDREIPVFLQRRDLAGLTGPQIRVVQETMLFGAGYWDLAVSPSEDLYFASYWQSGWGRSRTMPGRVANTVRFRGLDYVDIGVSSRPGRIRGSVSANRQPVAGAPVYLHPLDPDVHRRLNGTRSTLTGTRGEFRFTGLPPGEYLLASSFDLEDVNEDTLRTARAKLVSVKQGVEVPQDLDLYQEP